MMLYVGSLIQDGAITFLKKEYTYLTCFITGFAMIIFLTAEQMGSNFPYTTIAFLVGALTSMACGFIGMRIAVYANVRTTWSCNKSIDDGFHVAFNGG
jgi:Na+/H+-translocating membrane pyrophosphatase